MELTLRERIPDVIRRDVYKRQGTYTREQVPGLSNLRDVVYQVLDGTKGE